MRVIALLCLLFGTLAPLILDGQQFTHTIFGIACGVAALICGLVSVSAKPNTPASRWEGRIMAGLGLLLAVFLSTQIESAKRIQTNFNRIVHDIQTRDSTLPPPGAKTN